MDLMQGMAHGLAVGVITSSNTILDQELVMLKSIIQLRTLQKICLLRMATLKYNLFITLVMFFKILIVLMGVVLLNGLIHQQEL